MEMNVCAGTQDGSICGFDVSHIGEDSEVQLRFGYGAHQGAVMSMAMNGPVLLAASADDSVGVYDVHRRVEVGSLVEHEGAVNSVDVRQRHALTGSDDSTVGVWVDHDREWKLLRRLRTSSAVNDVAFHPLAAAALCVGADRTLSLLDLLSGKPVFRTKLTDEVVKVYWSEDGAQFVAAHRQTVSIFTASEGVVEAEIELPFRVRDVQLAARKRVVIAGDNSMLKVWDLRSGKESMSLDGHRGRVKALAALNDTMFSADSAGNVLGWSMRKHVRPLFDLCLHHKVTALAAGAWVAASSAADEHAHEPRDVEEDSIHHAEEQRAGRATDAVPASEDGQPDGALPARSSQRRREGGKKKRKVR